MIAHYGLVFVCFLIDGIINLIFPVKFGFHSMYFISSLGFCSLMLTTRKMNLTDSIIMAVLFGFLYGWGYSHSFFTYAILFVVCVFITRLWSKQINESSFENIVLCITTLFVKELMLYFYMQWNHLSAVDFNAWLVNRMFLTLLVNAILVVLLVLISYVKDDFLKRKEVQLRREEKLPWIH